MFDTIWAMDRYTATAVSPSPRFVGSAARSGADEFVCVLPGADRDQARAVAERIQQRFASVTSNDHGVGRSGASASSGVAVYPVDSLDVEGLLAAASVELTAAKRSYELTGRSRLRRRARDATAP